ncbi:RES family NAD+ phosphorylase [Mycolicibacterium sp. Y3]
MGATEFNTTAVSRRFRPVYDSGAAAVATIYGADLTEGALSETVFHDVPVRGTGRRILRKALVPMVMSTIMPARDLRLVELHGAGLSRLGVTHGELIESSAKQYPRTALWGQALYDHADRFDGLIWRSRQFNDSLALMLWGDRVDRFTDLKAHPATAPVPLFAGDGFETVQELADAVAITIVQ